MFSRDIHLKIILTILGMSKLKPAHVKSNFVIKNITNADDGLAAKAIIQMGFTKLELKIRAG